jgi:hypothetical protein
MAKHLIAVGGSGQHVALAYMDLAALAHHIHPVEPIYPYIVDKDETMNNGSTAWQEAIKQGELLRAADDEKAASWTDFGGNRIAPCRELVGRPKVRDAVSPIYGRLLLTPEQLEVEFATGYWGQAPVGAAFFGDIIRRDGERVGAALNRIAADPGARIVVAGSTVGGTGAGCLPRLVEHLAQRLGGGGGEARVMALPLLQWFALGAGGDQQQSEAAAKRNEEMKSRVPSALLYSRDCLAKDAATVLVGHPAPQGRERPWSGNTQQPPHEDLTVPYYAAIVASEFLFARRGTVPGIYSVPCPELQQGFHLDRSLWVFDGREDPAGHPYLQLGNLVHRNLGFCRRLWWVLRYLETPPSGRKTMWPGLLRVPTLDKAWEPMPAQERKRVLAAGKALLDAKWAALRRLYASDRALFGADALTATTWRQALDEQPPTSGVPEIRQWVGEEPMQLVELPHLARAILAQFPRPGRLDAPASPSRCLPPTVGRREEIAPPPKLPGVLDPCNIEQLLAFEQVAPESLPTSSAVEFYLEQLFAEKLGQDAVKEKTAQTWSKRWLTLLRGLAAGVLSLQPAPRDEGEVKLSDSQPQYAIADKDNFCFGLTSPKTLLVPAMTARWEDLDKQLSMADGGPADRAVMGWFELLERLRTSSALDSVPGWFTYNKRFWLDDHRKSVRPDLRFGFLATRPLLVGWGNGAPRPLCLPRPLGPSDQQNRQHLHDTLAFFGIEREAMDAAHLATEVPGLSALNDESRCPTYIPFGPKVDQTPRKVVWRSETPDLADALSFGFVLLRRVVDGRSVSVAAEVMLRSGGLVEVLESEQDILVSQVEPLGDNQKRKDDLYPDYPVRLRYAGLVDRTARSQRPPSAAAGVCRYEFRVHGINHVVTRDISVTKTRPGTFFLWPKFKPAQVDGKDFKAYYALAHSTRTGGSAWFLGQSSSANPHLDWSVYLKGDSLAQPLYSVNGEGVQGGIPMLMAVVQENEEAPVGGGLFSCPLAQAKDVSSERWGIDFGSSSSVVAVSTGHGLTGDAEVITLSGKLDATHIFAENEAKPLSSCYWFPTWDGFAPRTKDTSNLIPSQLLLTERVPFDGRARAAAEALPYGQAFVLDHGGELDEALQDQAKVIRDLKWLDSGTSDELLARRSLRRAYLLHLLEMCFALRAGLSGPSCQQGLPTSVTAVFTLPLRMRDLDGRPAKDFAEDADRVCRLLGELLGRRFDAQFIWESHVGAPRVRPDSEIYAVADLGGGSLDLWGAIGKTDSIEYADSYRFGGHDLLQQWCESQSDQKTREQQIVDLRRSFQIDPDRELERIRENRACVMVQIGFFLLAKEAVARWIGALVHKARATRAQADQGPTSYKVHLSLLGMGWGLYPQVAQSEATFVGSIGERVKQLLADSGGGDVDVRSLNETGERGGQGRKGQERKTYLARRAAERGGQDTKELLKMDTHPFLGCDIFQAQGPKFDWFETTPLRLDRTKVPFEILFDPKSVQAQPTPCLERHAVANRDLDQILLLMKKGIHPDPSAPHYQGHAPFSLVLESLRGRSKIEDSQS